MIRDLEADVAASPHHADGDLASAGRELRRVLDEVRKHLLDLDVIELDRWKVFRDFEADSVAGGDRAHLAGDVFDECADVMPCLVRDEAAVLDPREVQEVSHDAIETQGLVLDRAGELVPLPVGPGDIALAQAAG